MARARNIKPGFFTNDELVELPFATRLLFIGLWTIADREGRMVDRPKKIKMEIFPADDVDCDQALTELAGSGFIKRYQVGDCKVIEIANFAKHQAPHSTEKDSLLPDESGVFTVNERNKNGGITGKSSTHRAGESMPNVIPPLDNVTPQPNNALIPDCGTLIPDCGTLNPEPPPQSVVPAPATLLSMAFVAAGIQTQPADPRLIALAEQGVTVQTVAAACADAKAAKPNERIGVAYVLAILNRWSADAAKLQAGGANGQRPGIRTAAPNLKFNPNDQDRSGDALAMIEGMRRNGIELPAPGEEIDL